MKDGPVIRAVKAAARWAYRADLTLSRGFRRRMYRIAGSCRRCGACCRTPSIRVPPLLLYLKTTRRQLLAWHRLVNGFEIESIDRRHGVLTFRCTHFDSRTRLCDSYGSRPGMCRDYPQNLLDSPTPEFFEDCGFRPIVRNAEGLSRALHEAGVAPEILADLKKKLHLE